MRVCLFCSCLFVCVLFVVVVFVFVVVVSVVVAVVAVFVSVVLFTSTWYPEPVGFSFHSCDSHYELDSAASDSVLSSVAKKVRKQHHKRMHLR